MIGRRQDKSDNTSWRQAKQGVEIVPYYCHTVLLNQHYSCFNIAYRFRTIVSAEKHYAMARHSLILIGYNN